jgi:protein-S-isoprenylcysteine O-methyltransferase Ste14
MTTSRAFEILQLAAFAYLLCLAVARAAALYVRGIHVLAIDRQRTALEAFGDLAAVILFLWWGYGVVVYARPLEAPLVPDALGRIVVSAVAFRVLGAALVIAGLVLYTIALWTLADSWRLGIDRDRPGPLMTTGVFSWTRNPIYIALHLEVIGSFLLLGRLLFLAIALAIVPLVHWQIRREERFLAAVYGDAYREYCRRVGRYLTRA